MTPDKIEEIAALIRRLAVIAKQQREQRGDYLDYGNPDPWIVEAATALTELLAEREGLIARIRRAAKWFDDYERQHRAKRTAGGNMKADTNEERAAWLRAALKEPTNG